MGPKVRERLGAEGLTIIEEFERKAGRISLLKKGNLRLDVNEFCDSVVSCNGDVGELKFGTRDDYGRVVVLEFNYIIFRLRIELLGLDNVGEGGDFDAVELADDHLA